MAQFTKEADLHFRCSFLEKEVIRNRAINSNLSMSDYLRRCALNQKIAYKLTAEEIEHYKNFAKIVSDLQRIANLYKHKNPAFHSEVESTVLEIKELLKKFR